MITIIHQKEGPWCSWCGDWALAREIKRAAKKAGVIYLIRCGPYFKIGKTTDPDSRYPRLEIQLPHRPVILHEIQTDNVDLAERYWHQRFASKRLNGEWFEVSSQDINEISQKTIQNFG